MRQQLLKLSDNPCKKVAGFGCYSLWWANSDPTKESQHVLFWSGLPLSISALAPVSAVNAEYTSSHWSKASNTAWFDIQMTAGWFYSECNALCKHNRSFSWCMNLLLFWTTSFVSAALFVVDTISRDSGLDFFADIFFI